MTEANGDTVWLVSCQRYCLAPSRPLYLPRERRRKVRGDGRPIGWKGSTRISRGFANRLCRGATVFEAPDAFMRKGIAGDWRNYFSPEAGEAFADYAGDALIRLSYERSEEWIAQCRV